jgi:hypothetical protein
MQINQCHICFRDTVTSSKPYLDNGLFLLFAYVVLINTLGMIHNLI